jgi:DNA ligase-1
MLLHELVDVSDRVAGTASRLEKKALLGALLRRAEPPEVAIAVSYLTGEARQGRIGLGGAAVRDARPGTASDAPVLSLQAVDAAFGTLAEVTGAGSVRRRAELLRALLERATAAEQDFLVRLIYGELRQGALEGVLVDAIAHAAEVPVEQVRRAYLLSGDLSAVAAAALGGGTPALAAFGIQLFRPLQPMLAETADTVTSALAQLGGAALEYKLDGARVQVHKSGDDVRVFTRRLNDVTASVPELVAAVRALPAGDLVLDGEAIALRPGGMPHPFQVTMRRFGRKLDLARMQAELPLRAFFFDCLYLDGRTLVDLPARERFDALAAVAPDLLVSRLITDDATSGEAFIEEARAAGHEGVVAKALLAPYDAGRRGASWLKVKVPETLDLVVLAAEWGHGRRQGWLSNLHLGARDPVNGGYVMLGKTFKGLTDEMLTWQTRELLSRELGRDEWTVHVRPELVVEIAFDDIQSSPRYPGGVALRFARVRRYRQDKRAEDADTIEAVRAIYVRRGGDAQPA